MFLLLTLLTKMTYLLQILLIKDDHIFSEGDKKYLASLNVFVQTASKIEDTEYHKYCSVFKVMEILNRELHFFSSP